MQMLSQFGQRHPRADRNAVIYDVQVGAPKIHHPLPCRILDVGIANVPFPGHGPVKDRRAGRHFADRDRNFLLNPAQGGAQPFTGDAAADGIKLLDQAIHLLARQGRSRGNRLGRGIHVVFKTVTCISASPADTPGHAE